MIKINRFFMPGMAWEFLSLLSIYLPNYKVRKKFEMMKQIDMSSPEFLAEMEKTKKFTDKINKQFGYVYNPNEDVNEGVTMGLARHKILYGKRFCPCFMVEETEDGRFKSADDRVCPCTPAIEKEIPELGKCHCGIFCTPEYAANNDQ